MTRITCTGEFHALFMPGCHSVGAGPGVRPSTPSLRGRAPVPRPAGLRTQVLLAVVDLGDGLIEEGVVGLVGIGREAVSRRLLRLVVREAVARDDLGQALAEPLAHALQAARHGGLADAERVADLAA